MEFVTIQVRPACWGQFAKNVADRLFDDPPFSANSLLMLEVEHLESLAQTISNSRRTKPVRISTKLIPFLVDEVRNQLQIALDNAETIDPEERPRARYQFKILDELLAALIRSM